MSDDQFDEAVRAAAGGRWNGAPQQAFIEGAKWARDYLSQPENDPRQQTIFDALEAMT